MKRSALSRCALSISAAALLAGCGGSQPPIGTPETIARSMAARSALSSSHDLLYAINPDNGYVLTYPGGSPVGVITLRGAISVCSDQYGNVFVTGTGGGSKGGAWEFSHGATTSEQELRFTGYPGSCSVDPSSGNLAMTNNASSGAGDVGIYAGATGSPTYYTASNLTQYNACAYDSTGNLFVDGEGSGGAVLDVLPRGGVSFSPITLNKMPKGKLGNLQWHGTYLAVGMAPPNHVIYHVAISGNTGTIVGKTHATKVQNWWIQDNTLMSPYSNRSRNIALWSYPKGGKPKEIIKDDVFLSGLTVSVPPSHSVREQRQ